MRDVFYWRDNELVHLQDSETELRHWVLLALRELQRRYLQDGWPEVAAPEDTIEHVMREFSFCWVGSTLAAFTIGQPWFSSGYVLNEEFVMPFGTTPSLRDVDAAFQAIAKRNNVHRILLGSRAAKGGRNAAVARLYQRLGYSVSAHELTKVL